MSAGIVGSIIQGQYRVDQYIASGGMATVFRVWDLKRNVPLAMKVLNANLADDPSMLKLFRREAQALKKLTHPHIVPFYGLFESDEIYFLLEMFIDGSNLKDILRKAPGHMLSIEESLIYLKALCAAVGYAHANGVVHCDIKPGNVMVDRGGNIFLADFGIARHTDSSSTTIAGAGTDAYMAPEQIREEPVTPATDVYALGITVFEMLTGRRPFRGDDDGESGKRSTGERLRKEHLEVQAPDPREFRPDLPAELSAVILQALNKDPKDRYRSAMEFFETLCQAVEAKSATIPDRVEGRRDSNTTSTPLPVVPIVPKLLPKPKLWIWLSLATGVVGLTLIFLISRGSGKSQVTSTPATAGPSPVYVTPTLPPLIHTSTVSIVPSATPTAQYLPTPEATKPPVVDEKILVRIPPGEFLMGLSAEQINTICNIDPTCNLDSLSHSQPVHIVFLKEYRIYKTEVTNAMYAACAEKGNCSLPHKFSSNTHVDYYTNPSYANFPVVNVDWYQADQYCQWAGGRLPSEAEWEKAARGVNVPIWPWGNSPPSDNLANISTTNLTTIDDLTPVGSFPDGASPYQILDMAGNAYEWVADWYSSIYYRSAPRENPPGPDKSFRLDGGNPAKVVRGGSSGMSTWASASGFHDFYEPSKNDFGVGFRCVVDK